VIAVYPVAVDGAERLSIYGKLSADSAVIKCRRHGCDRTVLRLTGAWPGTAELATVEVCGE